MASKPDLSPPWTLFTDDGKPIAILPSGRPGEVLNVEGWSLKKASALVDAANQESQSFNARFVSVSEKLLALTAKTEAEEARATKKREGAGKRKL